MNDRAHSAEADLAFLRRVAEQGQRFTSVTGSHFMLWGGLWSVTLGLTYLTVTEAAPLPLEMIKWLFFGTIAVGWTGSMLLGYRDGRQERGERGAGIYAAIWIGMGLAATVVFFAMIAFEGLHESAMLTIGGALAGTAFFATAALSRIRWLYAVAIGWILTAAAGVPLIETQESLALAAVSQALLLFLPGLIIQLGRIRRLADA